MSFPETWRWLLDTRARHKPYGHQYEGSWRVAVSNFFGLWDEPRLGKSKQVIDAACAMWEKRNITKVLVVCPAQNRGETWFDQELGQIVDHIWDGVPAVVVEYHKAARSWRWQSKVGEPALEFVVTNYEWLRTGRNLNAGTRKRTPLYERTVELAKWCDSRTLLVLDESAAIASHKSVQTKMVKVLRAKCGKVVELNGTPYGHSPMGFFSQANMLSPTILDCPTMTHFKARHCVMGGWENRQVLKWINIDDLTRRLEPHVLARKKSECLDLPPQLPPVIVPFALTPATWAKYKAMRDDMVAWLDSSSAAVASQAFVKTLRLSQLTSGFVGGVEDLDFPEDDLGYDSSPGFVNHLLTGPEGVRLHGPHLTPSGDKPSWFDQAQHDDGSLDDAMAANEGQELSILTFTKPKGTTKPKELSGRTVRVSTERVDAFMDWWVARLALEPNLRLIVWCRFRPELEEIWGRLNETTLEEGWHIPVALAKAHGGQHRDERRAALAMVHPKTAPTGPFVLAATERTGGAGLNMAAANAMAYVSNDRSLQARMQSWERPHGPGQTEPIAYFEFMATGPTGQKTIDHVILKALRAGEDMANWTTAQWRRAITEE